MDQAVQDVASVKTTSSRPRTTGTHWWRELALVLVLYVAYSVLRSQISPQAAAAVARGRGIALWEQAHHLDPERALNAVLDHHLSLAVVAGYLYAVPHYVVTALVLLWLYRRHPRSYVPARRVLVAATVVALLGYWRLPTAPPRLVSGLGLSDVMSAVSHYGWWGSEGSAPRGLGGLTDQLAAMPSMHVGWALWCGGCLLLVSRNRVVRVLGVLYPVLVALVVMGTSNHYLVDALAGSGLVLLVWALQLLAARVLPHAHRFGRGAGHVGERHPAVTSER